MIPTRRFELRVQAALCRALADGVEPKALLGSLALFVDGIVDAAKMDRMLRESGDKIACEIATLEKITGMR